MCVCVGGGERQKFLSFPAGVFQIPQATALSAVRVRRRARGETRESRILERTRQLRTERKMLGLTVEQVARHSFRVLLHTTCPSGLRFERWPRCIGVGGRKPGWTRQSPLRRPRPPMNPSHTSTERPGAASA